MKKWSFETNNTEVDKDKKENMNTNMQENKNKRKVKKYPLKLEPNIILNVLAQARGSKLTRTSLGRWEP